MEPRRKKRKLECREQQETCSQQVSSAWNVLPELVLVAVFSLLVFPVDRRNVRLVCRHWCRCMNDSRLWKNSHLHVHLGSLTIPELSLLNIRQVHHISLQPLPPSKLSLMLSKFWYVLPRLKSLAIQLQVKRQKCYCLRHLTKLKHLEELTISGEAVPVTVPSMPVLKTLKICSGIQAWLWSGHIYKGLQWLEFEDTCITYYSETISLYYFPSLTGLSIIRRDMSYHCRWLFNMLAHYPLKVLKLSYCTLSLRDLRFLLSRLPSLHTLSLEGSQCSGGTCTSLALDAILSELGSLTLSYCSLTHSLDLNGLFHSQAARSLQHLRLAYCTDTWQLQLLEMRQFLPSLLTLDLTGWVLHPSTKNSLRQWNIQIFND
jgi:hypothetical protein